MNLYNVLSINGIDIDEYLGGGGSEEINEIKYNLNNLSNLYFKEHYNTNIAYVNSTIYEMFLINNNYDDINYDDKMAYLYI